MLKAVVRAVNAQCNQGKQARNMSAATVVAHLRKSFNLGLTKPLEWRRRQLHGLLNLIDENIQDILAALKDDLNKSEFESYLFEIDITRNDIVNHINQLTEWTKPTHVKKNLFFAIDTCMIKPEPLGVVLILGAWNYPFHLAIMPLIGALSAGNCAILKPSELSECTASLLSKLIPRYLDDDCVRLMLGGIPETTEILEERFDYIFYTGNSNVGRIIMKAAAKHLTPVTLELGGKSPVYVDRNCNLQTVANRIIWAKGANAGQTCVAPDYIMCHPEVQAELVYTLKNSITQFFGEDVSKSKCYPRIINNRHFLRVKKILDNHKPVFGGDTNEEEKLITPAILIDVKPTDHVMDEEIFGPVLPIMPVEDPQKAIEYIKSREKPLALYLFSNDSTLVRKFLSETSSGGVCVNDCVVHIGLDSLPFGGVGASGMGSYHGKFTFDTFSHKKSIMWKSLGMESLNTLRYAPFSDKNLAWIRRFTKKSLKSGSWVLFSLLGLGILGTIMSFFILEKSPLEVIGYK